MRASTSKENVAHTLETIQNDISWDSADGEEGVFLVRTMSRAHLYKPEVYSRSIRNAMWINRYKKIDSYSTVWTNRRGMW